MASTGDVGFVAPSEPIRIRQLQIGGALLTPQKFAVGFALNAELFLHSIPAAERVVRLALTESIAIALDAALLDVEAASDVRPAGIRHGIPALPATAGGTNEAMVADLAALGAAVAPTGGMHLAFVADPATAIKIALRAERLPFPVFSSGSLAAGTLLCVALSALASAIDPEPNFEISTEAVLHGEDTTPLPISAVAAPNSVAAPTYGLWQTNGVGIKVILQLSWALRSAGSVAWIEGVTW